jgi:hypothetical protein
MANGELSLDADTTWQAASIMPGNTSAYQQALELYEELGNAIEATEPRAGLAYIALAQNDLAGSAVHVETILQVLAHHPRAGLDEPFNVYLIC